MRRIATPQSTALSRFLAPLIELRHSLAEDASIDELIVANVKKTVKTVCESEVSRSRVMMSGGRRGGESVRERES